MKIATLEQIELALSLGWCMNIDPIKYLEIKGVK